MKLLLLLLLLMLSSCPSCSGSAGAGHVSSSRQKPARYTPQLTRKAVMSRPVILQGRSPAVRIQLLVDAIFLLCTSVIHSYNDRSSAFSKNRHGMRRSPKETQNGCFIVAFIVHRITVLSEGKWSAFNANSQCICMAMCPLLGDLYSMHCCRSVYINCSHG